MKKALCFLTVRPSDDFFNLIDKSFSKKYDIFIIIDDNDYNVNENYKKKFKIIQINNKEVENKGYKNSVLWCKNRACSRDKALYFLTYINNTYEYMWIIEEDVFIPNVKTLINIDKKYKKEDLLCEDLKIFHKEWNLWNDVIRITSGKLATPYFKSMICGIRISRKILDVIQRFATKHNTLFLDEALFTTLGVKNNLNIKKIDELSTLIYRKNWIFREIKQKNLYHPIKNHSIHHMFRNKLIIKNNRI